MLFFCTVPGERGNGGMSKYRVLDDNKNKYDGEVLTSIVTPETPKGFNITSNYKNFDAGYASGYRYGVAYNLELTFDSYNLNPSGGSYTEDNITALIDEYLNGYTISSNTSIIYLNNIDNTDVDYLPEYNDEVTVTFINKSNFSIRVQLQGVTKISEDDIKGELLNDDIDISKLDNVIINGNSTTVLELGNLHLKPETGFLGRPQYTYTISWDGLKLYRVLD